MAEFRSRLHTFNCGTDLGLLIKLFKLTRCRPLNSEAAVARAVLVFKSIYLGERVRGFCFLVRLSPLRLHTLWGAHFRGARAQWDAGSLGTAIAHLRDLGRLFALGFPAMVMFILRAVRMKCKPNFTQYMVD